MNDEPRLTLSEDEAGIERALEALAASERSGAPADLVDRVFAASASALRSAGPATASGQAGGPVRHVGSAPEARGRGHRLAGGRARALAIAAGLGAIACVTAAWLSLRSAPGGGNFTVPGPSIAGRGRIGTIDPGGPGPGEVEGTAIEGEVDALFAASSMLRTGLDEEIASIRMDAAALGLDLADPLAGGLGGGVSDSLTGSTWGGGSL